MSRRHSAIRSVPLITALVASDLEGTPLVPALERLAAEARLDRRRRAEEAARKVPVELLFPSCVAPCPPLPCSPWCRCWSARSVPCGSEARLAPVAPLKTLHHEDVRCCTF